MSPLKHSTNLAARMGRWSAGHRKTAIFGWLAFVAAAFAIGSAVGMKTIDQNDTNVGQARTADHMIRDAGFKLDEQMEYVLVQSQTQTVKDPAFRAVVDHAITSLDRFPQVTKLRSPLVAANDGQISPDGHSALIQFSPKGSYDEATAYIDKITASTANVQKAHPDFYVGEAGSASTGKALDSMFNSQLARAGLISIPLTLAILLLVFGSLVGAMVPLLLALTSVFATMGLVALPSQIVPMDQSISEVILLIGLAVGVDYSLFYIRRERDERAGGTERVGRSRGRRSHVRAGSAHLRLHGHDRDGRDVLLGRQDVHVVRDRDDAGRRRGDDRLADGAARGPVVARRPGRQGAGAVPQAAPAGRRREPRLGRDPRPRPRPAAGVGHRVGRCPRRARASGPAPAHGDLGLRRAAEVDEGGPGAGPRPGRLPGRRDSRDRRDQGRPAGSEDSEGAVRPRAEGSRLGPAHQPIHTDVSPDRSVIRVVDPARRERHRHESNAALATLRDEILPETVGAVDGVEYAVTGDTAASHDWNEAMKSAAPLVFGFVLAFAFLLLLVSFRSLVIPIKAIVMNLLSSAPPTGCS